MLGVRLLNQFDKDQLERIKEKLEQQINKVPDRVRNGSVQATREWMRDRDEAVKMLRKTNVGAPALLAMISRLQ